MLLLGFITFFALSYTESTSGGYTTHSSTNWSVNGFWTGGYENGCRWYDKLMEALAAPRWPPVATALSLVFGVLAVVVKLHVTALLPGTAPAGTGPPADDGAGAASDAPSHDPGETSGGTELQADRSFLDQRE
jgi:hypothetical protein